MRILTVRQPWAAAMFVDHDDRKNIENRAWPTRVHGRIGIHAGLRVDDVAMEWIGEPPLLQKSRGVVLGTVEIVDVHEVYSEACARAGCRRSRWAHLPSGGERVFHWMLAHPVRFRAPIRATGRLGLWTPGPSLDHLMRISEVERCA